MALTDTAIKGLRPAAKPFKRYDENGLFLLVRPNGAKWWRYRYRFGGREKLLSLGVYPDVGLRKARDLLEEARNKLRNGIDPSDARKALKLSQSGSGSFEAVAREWLLKMAAKWSEKTLARITKRLNDDLLPWLGNKPMATIKASDVLPVLRRIEHRGAVDTAHRAMQECGQIFRYAVASGRAERDPTADLRGALSATKVRHHATIIDPDGVGALLRAIEAYKGYFITRCALRLAPLVFVRPGELRQAQWDEFDLDKKEWHIPAERMKMRAKHIVPLSDQAVAVLQELHPLTKSSPYVFPSARSWKRPMSENAVLAALRRMGYATGTMTGHGFRSMASTLLNEQGWNRDAIERQLAHAERDSVRASYNYAEHLPERRRMMQSWADYLDRLKAQGNVVAGKFGRAA